MKETLIHVAGTGASFAISLKMPNGALDKVTAHIREVDDAGIAVDLSGPLGGLAFYPWHVIWEMRAV